MIKWSDKEASVRALESNGKVDPNDLIEAARDPNHPCHGDFTWDVDLAAQERWRDQARLIIRKCKFEVKVEDVTSPIVRYVESPDDDDPVFISLPKLRSATKASAVLAREVAMLHGNAARVHGIALSKVGIVGVEMVRQLQEIRTLVEAVREELSG